MPVTLFQPLPEIAFSRNEIPFIVSSDDYLAGVPAFSVSELKFNDEIEDGHEITITWAKGTVTFTARNVPDDSALQFPAGDGGNVYVNGLVEWFQGQLLIDRDFVVTANTAGPKPVLLFTAISQHPDYDLNPFDTGATTITVLTPGVSSAAKSNFMHHNQVHISNAAGTAYLQADNANRSLDIPLTGKTSTDIGEQVLHSFLSPDYPELQALYARCRNSIRSYYCKYAQCYGLTPTVRKISKTPVAYVTWGGLSVQASQARDIITELCPVPGDAEQNRFLRQGSKNKLVRTDQPEWLTFLNLTAGAMVADLEVTIVNEDETEHTFNAVDGLAIPAYSKFQFQTGFTQLGIPGRQAADKRPVYYTCRIKTPEGYQTAPYAYVIEYQYREWPRYFVYFNSYGAFQTIATTGKQMAEYDRLKDDARRAQGYRSAAIAGDFMECNISIREKYTVNVGYPRSGRRNTDLLRDFTLSPAVYLWDKGKLIPVGLNTKNLKDALDGENVFASSFEYFPKYEEVTWTEDPALVTDDSVNDLLEEAGIAPPHAPEDPNLLEGGNIIVSYGDTHLSVSAGLQKYKAPYWLAGRSGYVVYSTQMARHFFPEELTYNSEGSFTIQIPGFRLQNGDQLIIWPFKLNPDYL